MAAPPIVALEIGTSKIVALVGETREDNYIMITGTGECPSKGIRKGEIVDVNNASACVRRALDMAEENGKVSIREVVLAISGVHVQSMSNRGTVPILSKDGIIGEDDVEQVREVAKAVNLPTDREILHSLDQYYSLDDQDRVMKPEGMSGARLSHDMLVLHCVRSRLETSIRLVQSLSVDVDDVVFSGLCSGMSVLTPEHKRGGVVVVDLGGGATDYMAYASNVPAAAGVLGVGGDHVTNDIAMAFNISTSQAERLKRESGCATTGTVNRSQRLSMAPEVGFPGRSVNLSSLHSVIHARMEESLTIVRDRLSKEQALHHLGVGVVLTGGGAHLKGVVDLTEEIFQLPCEIGRPRGVTGVATVTDGPEYATCSGLVQYGFKAYSEKKRKPLFKQWLSSFVGG
jgi:cell division protein FtsA